MNMKSCTRHLWKPSLAVTFFIALMLPCVAAPKKLNVVLILADDLGWTDLACFGSKLYETPNIDRLARAGVKFTQAYAACCVCSPTRGAILTGKYPARTHITDWIPGLPPPNPKLTEVDWTKYLPLNEVTIAAALHPAGYASASIGKWHLGGEEYWPEKHGFDLNIAGTEAPSPKTYFAPYDIKTLREGPTGEYLTDRLGDEAVRWIEAHKEKPFFLYLPHFAVHLPVQGKKEIARKYHAKIGPGMMQTNAMYAAMIESLDAAVGQVRRKLEDLKLTDHTVVFFASDNGGRVPTTSNLPLRVGKGSCYEGGTRVPFIAYWPGVTKAGTVCDTPVISMDLFPTILEMVGVKEPPGTGTDGVSLVPLLRRTCTLNRDALFWHYPHYQLYQLGGTTPYGAIHAGDYKLIEFYENMHVELYNLHDDIGEQHDLAAQMPDKTNELRDRLHAWRKAVGAQMPGPNPNYDPSKPEFTRKPKKQAALGEQFIPGRRFADTRVAWQPPRGATDD